MLFRSQKIEDLLKEEGFIKDPHVNVFVAEHKSKTVSVLGYEPTADIESEIALMLGDLIKYRDRIEARREVLMPDVRWDGRREKCSYIETAAAMKKIRAV